jgi:mono/diheme cytochrome c family protein
MSRLAWFLGGAATLVLLAAASGAVYLELFAHGFSARAEPPAIEAFAAAIARSAALPEEEKELVNPVPASDEVLAEARAHWADHCAICHANDGSGQIPMGQQMYPRSPDMRKIDTQRKTDGELFYIIENGVRLSGMPAWGGSAHSQQDSWKLVRFIRHLPSLSQAEIREMETLNPKTPADLEEEKQEEEFLKGGSPRGRTSGESPAGHHHH